MAWKTLKTHTYYGAHGASDYGDDTNWVKFTLQYDDSSNCVTELKIRFVVTPKYSSYYPKNGYHIYVNPRTDGKIAVYDTTNNYYKPFDDGTLGEIILRAKAPAPNGSHDGFDWFSDVTVTDSTSGAVARTYLHGNSACSGGSSCTNKSNTGTYCNGSHCRQGTILLKKAYNAASFTIPSYALVCPGYPQEPEIGVFKDYVDYDEHVITYQEGNLHYPGSGKALVYDYFFKEYRTNFKEYISGSDRPSTTSISKKATNNGAGNAISVVSDGDGNATINIPSFTLGDYNEITATSITIQFQDDNGTVKKAISKTATGSYTETIPAGATKVYVKATGTSRYGSNVSKSTTLKVYTKPSIANLQISWDSHSRKTDDVPSNIKANATAKLKDTITWSWSGAKAGINTPIAGYRIFVYKSIGHKLLAGKSRYSYIIEENKVKLKTTLQDSAGNALNGNSLPLVSGMVIDGKKTNVFSLSYTPNDAVLESTITEYDTNFLKFTTGATGGSLSFNPKAAGFENKDYCIFEVILYYNWKNSESANAVTEYATPITSEPENDCYSGAIGKSCNCYFKNSANVWVKTTDSNDSSAWKEAESIWVKTSSGWKEAEGLWVKTDADTWSESS